MQIFTHPSHQLIYSFTAPHDDLRHVRCVVCRRDTSLLSALFGWLVEPCKGSGTITINMPGRNK